MTDPTTQPAWAGFWRRVAAYLLDGLILGALGAAAGYLLFDQLSAIPGPTRLIGLAAGLLYFGVLTSGAGGGATLGMRLLDLRVRSMRGRPLNLVVALWRALVLQAPLILNGMALDLGDPLYNQIFLVVGATLVFGVLLAQVVLLLFNAPSRRLAHDLVSGSAVVRSRWEGPLPKTRSAAQVVALLLVLAAFGGSLYLTGPFSPLGTLQQKAEQKLEPLVKVQHAVQALPEVMEVGVNDNTHTFTSNGTTTVTRTLHVTARLNAWPKDEQKEIARIGETVLAVHELEPGQKLQITLRHGYDIGIASFWRSSWNGYPSVAEPAEAAKPEEPATPAGAVVPAQPAPPAEPAAAAAAR